MAGTSDYHHGDLSQALIEAGAELIERNGVSNVSLREVAKAAGVSHTAPYRHFKDKNALLAGISKIGFQRLADQMRVAVEQNPENPREQLVEAGIAYISTAIDTREMFHLMFGGLIQSEGAGESFKKTSGDAFQGLVTIIHNGQQAGLYRKSDTQVLALTAWCLVHGYAMLASTGKLDYVADSKDSILVLARTIEAHLIDGIGGTQ